MKHRLLFPYKFRYLGYLLTLPGFILGYIAMQKNELLSDLVRQLRAEGSLTGYVIEKLADEFALVMVIAGMLFIAFSKFKREDELISKIRIYALYRAILVNYVIYVLLLVFVLVCISLDINPGGDFLGPYSYLIAFSIYNLFSPLVIFIVIFYYQVFRNKNEFMVKPIKYLPYRPYRIIGQWLSSIIVLLLIVNSIGNYAEDLEALFYLLPITLMMWAYSKEKNEDECISETRLEAMNIAIYVNYAILIISNFTVYGWDFWTVQMLNLATIPTIFLIWFRFKMYRINRHTEIKPITS